MIRNGAARPATSPRALLFDIDGVMLGIDFERALRRRATGVAPAATPFFDDGEENVVGARGAGLEAVLVRSPRDVTETLARLDAPRA